MESLGAKSPPEVSPDFFAQCCRLVPSPVVYSAGALFLQLGEHLSALGFTLDMCLLIFGFLVPSRKIEDHGHSGFRDDGIRCRIRIMYGRRMSQTAHSPRGTNVAEPRGISCIYTCPAHQKSSCPATAPRPILNNPRISSLIQLRPLPSHITRIHRSTRLF